LALNRSTTFNSNSFSLTIVNRELLNILKMKTGTFAAAMAFGASTAAAAVLKRAVTPVSVKGNGM
jgi:hypothetical protein